MAEKNTPANAPAPAVKERTSVSAEAVLAARLKRAQDLGILTPKMQRGFDRMTAGIVKGNK